MFSRVWKPDETLALVVEIVLIRFTVGVNSLFCSSKASNLIETIRGRSH